jgi:hypothetical protein
VRQQILGSIRKPLKGGGHFLNDISTCGHQLSLKVEHEFSILFEQLINILRLPTNDPISRILSLGITGLSFRSSDVQLLQNTELFQLLCDNVSEKDISEKPQKEKIRVDEIEQDPEET